MKEIEDFFKVGDERSESLPEKAESLETKTTVYDERRKLDKFAESVLSEKEHTAEESWHTQTSSEHVFTEFRERQREVPEKKVAKLDSSVEAKAALFEKRLEKGKLSASDISKKIKERLRNPASLKDYIVISEIMNKPKALRR